MIAAAILAALVAGQQIYGRHVLVTAHPDDETISFGGALSCIADVRIVQLTDGQPRAEGREAMLPRRGAERAAALAAGGWACPVKDGGAMGREAHRHLPALLALVRGELTDADVVWTHPYEGGHLDHDSAAWLVQTACAGRQVLRLEFASYHAAEARQVFGEFWPDPAHPASTAILTADRWARKQAALAAYASQAHILRKFKTPQREPYRAAPIYDFTRPPAPPRSRWDSKGYQPPAAAWRAAVAAQRVA